MEQIVARKGLGSYFVAVHGSPRTKTEIVRQLLADYHLDPSRVLFLGDAMADYEAAQAADLHFIGRVPEGHANMFPPDVRVVQDLTELLIESFCPG
jgi:phosphoglycolate phosphatase-like HAD superfamily hydrolase